jgi:serine/threonine-protein kinase RsbW
MMEPARSEHLPALMRFVAERARSRGFDHKKVNEVELAVEEALVNIMKYAYPDGAGDVRVACEEQGAGLRVEITDSGIPFDPLAPGDPDLSLGIEDRPIGGLGIFLIRKLATEVRYRRENDTNHLILTFSPANPA